MLEAVAKKRAHEPLLEMLKGTPLALKAAEGALGLLREGGAWQAKEALRRLADAVSVHALEAMGEPYGEMARLYARRFLEGESLPRTGPSLYDPWWSLS
jgi:hypothetical protein